jgi:lipoprotein-anchoring transpeptidase ErfK/SrfK
MFFTERNFSAGVQTAVPAVFLFILAISGLSLSVTSAWARESVAGEHIPENVVIPQNYPAGIIIIKQSERRLYYVTGPGMAIAYPVAIGRAGKAWRGETAIRGKFVKPAWIPPEEVRRDHPEFPPVIPGGSPRNPMGAAALTLELGEVAIHGTTQTMRKSIGTAASYGCIRMYNEDVVDLFQRVEIGTKVVSIP